MPALPRMRLTASGSVMPAAGVPSMLATWSPVWIPARWAGVPSIGVTTLSAWSLRVSSMPMPTNAPLISTCMSP